jgi:hypothetical protein
MKRFLISIIIVFVSFAGSVFLLISHAGEGNNLDGDVAWNTDHLKKIRTEREGETVDGLASNGEARTKRLAVGLWGGEHIGMQVSELRTTIEYDCARGTIEQRIALDRRGRFDVPGVQVAERGGPVRQNEQLTGDPVRFSGQVKGKRMELTVRNSVTKTLVGNFTLVYGVEPKLRKCR